MLTSFISYGLLVVGAVLILGNWWIAASYFVWGKHDSLVPLIGGLLAFVGLLISPHPSIISLWWLPLLFDLGCVPMVVAAIVRVAIDALRNRS